jgi:hypothetical protein
MNQPYSSCRTYFEEVLQIAEACPSSSHHPGNPLSDLPNPEANYESFDPNLEPATIPEYPPPPEDAHMDDIPDPTNDNPFFTEFYPDASRTFGIGQTFVDVFDNDEFAEQRKEFLYYPFASKDEWELASFLLRSGLSMASTDKFLKLNLVSYHFFVVNGW